MRGDKVLFKAPISKQSVQDALSDDWNELDKRFGSREAFKAQIGARHVNTIGTAISRDHLPEAHTVLNSLLSDPAALFNTLRLFGGVFVPIEGGTADDMKLISDMLHAATEAVDRKRDGVWCPSDRAALAKLFKPLIPAMLAIIDGANGRKVAALKAVNE